MIAFDFEKKVCNRQERNLSQYVFAISIVQKMPLYD